MPLLILANKRGVLGPEEGTASIRAGYPAYRVLESEFLGKARRDQVTDSLLHLLGLIRVYLVEKPAADAERTPHLVLRASTVQEIAEGAGSPRDEPLKSAKVWGNSVTQPGQIVSLQHLAQEGDIIHLQT